MDKQIIKTRTSLTWIEEDNIIRVEVLPGAKINLENAKEDIAIGKKLLSGKQTALLIDLEKVQSVSQEARQFYKQSSKSDTQNKAVAIIIKNPLSTIIANFFLGFNKPNVPIRLFQKKDEAVVWLKKYLDS